MKKVIFFSLVLTFLTLLPVIALTTQTCSAAATETTVTADTMTEQEKALELGELENFIREVDREVKDYLPEISLTGMIQTFKEGKLNLSPQGLVEGIFRFLFQEILGSLQLAGKLLAVAVVCCILQNLQSAFAQSSVAKLAHFVGFLVVITIALVSFQSAAGIGFAAIGRMVDFMKLLLPVLLILLTAMGGLTSAALLQPFLLVFMNFMGAFAQGIIFPLIYLHAALAVITNLSETFSVSRLAGLVKLSAKVGIGLILTVFIGVITVAGVAGAVTDGVALRTAKFMTGTFIPVAGSMFADALDAVIGGSLLLKNAIGLTGVIVLGMIAIFPALKILAAALIYKLTAALIQPLGDTMIGDTLEVFADSLFLAFAAILSVALMFFITVAIIVGTANLTVMLR